MNDEVSETNDIKVYHYKYRGYDHNVKVKQKKLMTYEEKRRRADDRLIKKVNLSDKEIKLILILIENGTSMEIILNNLEVDESVKLSTMRNFVNIIKEMENYKEFLKEIKERKLFELLKEYII